ncbi:MAG: hypothetical protein IJP70_02130 [Bacteroidales bacterium]|nr:hypothetical protein [Bacteroidales bacterium]
MKPIEKVGKNTKSRNNWLYKHAIHFICSMMLVGISILFCSCSTDDQDEYTNIYTETHKSDQNTNFDDYDNSSDTDWTNNESNAEAENLLINGGMENWFLFTYEILDAWLCHNNYNVKRESKNVYEGHYSTKMQSKESGSTATVDQCIPVEPNGKIRIRFHYYVEQWKANGARTYCYFRTRSTESSTISADELKSFYDKDTYYIIRGGGYGLTYLPHDLNIWQVFDETIEVPPTATYFVFGVNSYYGTTIYVDDCWVTDEIEHSTTGINPVKM